MIRLKAKLSEEAYKTPTHRFSADTNHRLNEFHTMRIHIRIQWTACEHSTRCKDAAFASVDVYEVYERFGSVKRIQNIAIEYISPVCIAHVYSTHKIIKCKQTSQLESGSQ